MAFISSAFTAGQTLTAASMEDLRGNANAGHSVFTNEAARDAAITAPTEGMMAYLTAPTVPAATGGTTGIPTGIQTIYNGSSWVCVTPVTARDTTSGTRNTTSYGALTGGTNPSVTLTTGTTALVSMSVVWANGSTGVGQFAAIVVSGATTVAAADANAVLTDQATANYYATASMTVLMASLTAGTNTFTMEYKPTGGTVTVLRRAITVQGIA